jgi:integral membrane protein (TIGR00529 family)
MIAILGVPVAFATILLLVRKKVSYGVAIIVGSLIIGVFSGFSLGEFVDCAGETLRDEQTLTLVAVITLIGIMGYSFKQTGRIDVTINELRGISGEKTILAAIPAAFGMLPIPGGALMSAPVIEPEADRLKLTPEHKTYLNLWFRHALLIVFPLSTTLILPASLAGISVFSMIKLLVPLFVVAVVTGYVVGLRPIKRHEGHPGGGSLLRVVYGLSPILLVITLNAAGIPLVVGLILGLVLLFLESNLGVKQSFQITVRGISINMAVAMVGIMFFRQVVNTSPVVTEVMDLLEGSPAALLIVGLPIVVSIFMGLALLSIGVCFPLLEPISPFSLPVFATILYTSAFAGYLASPLHLCLILTKEYFHSSLFGVYRRFLPSVGVIILYNICFTLFFLWLL